MKLPVFQTFSNALGFAFSNFFTCFRLAWLPFTLLFAVHETLQWFIAHEFEGKFPMTDVVNHKNPVAIFQFVFDVWSRFASVELAMLFLQALVIAAVAVSIHRVILFGERREGSVLNFAFGKTEFLYMLMAASMALIALSLLGSFLVPAVYVASNGNFETFFSQFSDFPNNMERFVRSGQFGILMFAYAAAWLLVIFVSVRLAVWPPSVVATGSLSPSEPWNLMRGNVLRFIGMLIVTLFFVWIIMACIGVVFMTSGGLEAVKGLQMLEHQNPFEMRRHMQETMLPYLPVIFVVGLIVYIFMTSFAVALISYSYKALRGYDAASPITA
ncbi:MAG: hypothetical protein ABL973_01925 [Micropepsaceae bacterium]